MTVPNPELAFVDIEKLREYCLSPNHPRGRHKARVFSSSLGLTADDAELLRVALCEAAKSNEAVPTHSDDYGQRYVIDFQMNGPDGSVTVRSSWIVRKEEDYARLTSCYVL